MSAHTPGPWTIYDPVSPYPGVEAVASQQTIVLWGYGDDDCGVRGKNPKEIEANARLISAAPDLLEACQAALATHSLAESEPSLPSLTEVEDMLLAAIAKATGAA